MVWIIPKLFDFQICFFGVIFNVNQKSESNVTFKKSFSCKRKSKHDGNLTVARRTGVLPGKSVIFSRRNCASCDEIDYNSLPNKWSPCVALKFTVIELSDIWTSRDWFRNSIKCSAFDRFRSIVAQRTVNFVIDKQRVD